MSHHHTSTTPDHDRDATELADATDEGRNGRRGLLLGALAAAAGAMVVDAGEAAAVDPNDVVLGSDNISATTTGIAISQGSSASALRATVPANSSAVVVQAAGGDYGLRVQTRLVGVEAVAGDAATAVSGVGVSGVAAGPQAVGVRGSSNSVGVRGTVGSMTMPLFDAPVAVQGFGGTIVTLGGPVLRRDADGSSDEDADDPAIAPKHGDHAVGGAFWGARAALWLMPTSTTGAPETGPHSVGEIVVDSEGRMFVCRTAGTPGTWSELTATAAPRLVLLPSPERFVDTRTGLGGVQGPVPAESTRVIAMTGRNGERNDASLSVPDRATAIVGNLSVLGTTSAAVGSYVTLWASGPRPATANITYGPSSVISNSFVVGLADTGGGRRGISVYDHGACDYVVDVTGYYVEG